jgi:hypothetical protein
MLKESTESAMSLQLKIDNCIWIQCSDVMPFCFFVGQLVYAFFFSFQESKILIMQSKPLILLTTIDPSFASFNSKQGILEP